MSSIPSYVDLHGLDALIREALKEDVGSGDITSESTISVSTTAVAVLKAKENGIIAGLFVAEKCFHEVDPTLVVTWNFSDGAAVSVGDLVGEITGNARSILLAERVALNFLQRMSGIATLTHTMVSALKTSKTKLLDTRKTLPGLRSLDKWAVLLGGGLNHRVGLFDMILIKENHISAAGGIENALDGALKKRAAIAKAGSEPIKIEIEVTSISELNQVLSHGGADRVMLDNFVTVEPNGSVNVQRLQEAVDLCQHQIETEASGNVTLATLGAIGSTGVDYVSSGALTHSVMALDLSLIVTLHRTHKS